MSNYYEYYSISCIFGYNSTDNQSVVMQSKEALPLRPMVLTPPRTTKQKNLPLTYIPLVSMYQACPGKIKR